MKIKPLLGLTASVAVLGVIGLKVDVAQAETKTVQSGNVRAELNYECSQKGESGDYCLTYTTELTIMRGGQTLYQQKPAVDEYDRPLIDSLAGAFQVRDVNGDREPEVIVDFFTGGAHCCTYSLIYRYNPQQKQYSALRHEWMNAGYILEDLDKDGIPEFRTRDDRFAYAFGSYAGSRYPVQVWRYQAGKMVDVTRRYPQLIRDHAYELWQSYQKGEEEKKAILAAYLASKYLLGEGEDGWRRVRQTYRGSDRQQFFNDLANFLKETSYTAIPQKPR